MNSQTEGQLFLTDTGASISTIPNHLYKEIHPAHRPPLKPSPWPIQSSNGTSLGCDGYVFLEFKIENKVFKHPFFVCPMVVHPILGHDFQKIYDLYVRPGTRSVYIGDQQINGFDECGYLLKSKVTLGTNCILLPNEEAVLPGQISNKSKQDGKVLAVQRAATTFSRTGAMVCHIVTRAKNNSIPLRVANLSDQPLTLKKGSVMAIAEPVLSVSKWNDVDEIETQENIDSPKPKLHLHVTTTPEIPQELPQPHVDVTTPKDQITKEKPEYVRNSGIEANHLLPPTAIPQRVETHNDCECKCNCNTFTVQEDESPKVYCVEPTTNLDDIEYNKLCCHSLQPLTPEQKYKVLSNAQSRTLANVDKRKLPEELPDHVKVLYKDSLPRLETQDLRDKVAWLLYTYADCFAVNNDDIGKATLIKHDIDTGDAQPVRQRCRRFAKCHIEAIKDHVKKLSDAGIIRPSNSEWASNIVVVRKKDGTWRMCIDYRELNAKTRNPDSYLLPRIDDTLDALADAKVFCTLDLTQGYHHVELTDRSKVKTAFHAPYCNPPQWEYNYMPFGLVRAPRTFQRLMDKVIQGFEYKIALCYIDDIIIYARNSYDCITNLELIFNRVRAANLKLKAKKCVLFAEQVSFLGHLITKDGVATDPVKIDSLKDRHPPRTVKQTRAFLGLANYYHRFIKNYAHIAQPLYELTKKGAKFRWKNEHQQAFETIKEKLISAEVMAYPRQNCMFILDTDASDRSYGAVLSQIQTKDHVSEERVIAYYSHNFTNTERNYCARRRELLAIVNSVKHFEVYLKGPTFLIRTDHASLRFIKTIKELPGQFARWIMYLEEFSYKIEVRKGTLHSNADGLSRGCNGKVCICDDLEQWEKQRNIRKGTKIAGATTLLDDDAIDQALIFPTSCTDGKHQTNECLVAAFKLQPTYTAEELAGFQEKDIDIGPVYRAKLENPDTRPQWNKHSGTGPATKVYLAEYERLEFHNKVLYRRWESNDGLRSHLQFLVPRVLQKEMLEKVHDSKNTAHMGRRRTMYALQNFCYWYKMFEDVVFWISTCQICQRRKPIVPKPRAPMQIYTTGAPYERISMDVCGPLVTTPRNNAYVLVVSDHFTRYTRAFAMPDQQATTVARILIYEWFAIYGEPMQIHSDQGTNFESKLMHELCDTYGIEKTRTTPFHPQADGMVERFNKTVMNLVYSIVDKKVTEWDEALPHAVSAYNASIHATTGFTPNRLTFGYEIRHSDAKIVPDPNREDQTYSEFVIRQRELKTEAFDIARDNIRQKALLQKKYYDRKSNLIHYRVGDPVWILISSKPEKGHKKLVPKYKGPFWIVDKLSDVNFRIAENEESKMRVIHHDRLKPYKSREPLVTPEWVYLRSKSKRETLPPATNPTPVPKTPLQTLEQDNTARKIPKIVITPPDVPHQKGYVYPAPPDPNITNTKMKLPSQTISDETKAKLLQKLLNKDNTRLKVPTRTRRKKNTATKVKQARKIIKKAKIVKQKRPFFPQSRPSDWTDDDTADDKSSDEAVYEGRKPKEKDPPPRITTRRGRNVRPPARYED